MSSSEKRLHSMAAELEAAKVGPWYCHTCNRRTAVTDSSRAQAMLSAVQQCNHAPSLPAPWARRAL